MKNVIWCETDFEKIKSPNLNRFINEYGARVDKDQVSGFSFIPLPFLRNVYGKDKDLFFRLVKEFGLRGYKIAADNSDLFYNDVVPFYKQEGNSVLRAKLSDEYSWKKLVLPPSIQEFLSESNVESSDFFNGIIASNLFVVFPGIDESVLTALSKVGVTVASTDDSGITQQNQKIESTLLFPEKITNLFNPDHDMLIISAFNKNGIETTDDITEKRLQEVFETKGIGKKKADFIRDKLQSYTKNFSQRNELQKEQSVYIKIFPEVILHSYSIRKMFIDNSQVELRCTENGRIDDRDLMFLNLNQKLKKYKTLKQLIEKDIALYLSYANEHAEFLLEQKQINWIIVNFKFTDVLLNAINQFNDSQRQEFYRELNYENCFSLDKRLDAVESEFVKKASRKKHWSMIAEFRMTDSKSTLQEIGDAIGLSRERVRQIETQISSLKAELSRSYRIEQMLRLVHFKQHQSLVFIDELSTRLLDLLKYTQSKLIIQPNNKDETPFIIINQEKGTLTEVNNWVDRLQNENELNLVDFWDFFKGFNNKLPEKVFKEKLMNYTLKSYHYDYVFPYFAYKRRNKAQIVYQIYSQKFGNEFSVSDLPYSTLNQEYQIITGHDLLASDHKRDSEILVNNMLLRMASKTPGILYIGSGEYEDDPTGKIDNDFWEKVKLFIVQSLQEVASIKINKIYAHFKSYLMPIGINSPRELYFILKEYLSDSFSFAEGNEFSVWKMNADRISNEQILIDLVRKNNNLMSESDVIETLGWTKASVEQTIYPSSNLSYNKGKVYYQDHSNSVKIREFIYGEISKQIKAHPNYVLVRPIQQQLKSNWELYGEITNMEILQDLSMFADFMKAICVDWKGYSQVLYRDKPVDEATILFDHFGDKPFDKDNYNSFLTSLGYKPSTISLKLNKLVSGNVIAKVGPDNLMFTKFLNIQSEDQLKIDKYLLGMFDSNQSYISLVHEIIIASVLPEVSNLMWTRELLFYFASKSLLVKPLSWPKDAVVTSFPVNPMIIVKRNDVMNSLLDLTKHCIENFDGNRSVVKVRDHLLKKGILIGKTKDGTLPEILNSILYMDDDNVVHLKEQEVDR